MPRFYPPDAPIPADLSTGDFIMRPLTVADNALDYEAVMASQAQLREKSGGVWPRPDFSLAENQADMEQHAADFAAREGFTYTIMNPSETLCLGCVYIYPLERFLTIMGDSEAAGRVLNDEAEVRFWARSDRLKADLDTAVLTALIPWLQREWAFAKIYFRVASPELRQLGLMEAHGMKVEYSLPMPDRRTLFLFGWGRIPV